VQPDAPVNLTLETKTSASITNLWAKWSPPPIADVRSNSHMYNYELRLKTEGMEEWETISVGVQTQYKVIRVQLGVKYVVQVRCMLDLGKWSEWSSERRIQIPKGQSPPEKPTIIKCRSPEKETFTCWWKPASDGGYPITHTLLYSKEGDHAVVFSECKRWGGVQVSSTTSVFSAFLKIYANFDTIMGKHSSHNTPLKISFILTVQPDPPVNITLELKKSVNRKPYLILTWSPPPLADVRSGWLTLEYELRLKLQEGEEWETVFVGQQTQYKMFSLNTGKTYIIQIHCKPDHHGSWSEWSPEKYIQIPTEYRVKDMVVWIVVGVLSSLICLIMSWIMILKGYRMVAFILPPVPGPKITGIDKHLLQRGKSEELLSALGCHGFPPTSDCEELLVEYLEVEDSEEQQLMPSRDHGHASKNIKMIPKETDSDSGRGSCDSPSLLSEKCKGSRAHTPPSTLQTQGVRNVQENKGGRGSCEILCLTSEHRIIPINNENPRSSTWPPAQLPNNQPPMFAYHSTVDAHTITLSATDMNIAPVLVGNEENHQPQYPITGTVHDNLENRGEMENFHSKTDQTTVQVKQNSPNGQSPFLNPRLMDYVEVHKVRQDVDPAVLLKCKENSGQNKKYTVPGTSKEYTKVSTVVDHNILVLMPDARNQQASVPQEPAVETPQNVQQSEAETDTSYTATAPSEMNREDNGSDYMDPSSFMPPFK
ncbi:PRLR protein, partial [Eolophus roseicapillus]|nr:PRLR protein [Eolophus roseicapilla]